MANAAWKTKADIVNDLTKVTGSYVDENFIVQGFRPPPPIRSNEDDEMRLLFGDHYKNGESDVGDDIYSPPDLLGIQKMLQMVNDLEDGNKNGAASSQDFASPGDVITISKLNPNVQEFVPKSLSRASQKAPDELKNGETETAPIPSKTLDNNNLNNEDIKKLRESLKSKISDASKSDTFQSKREKNVAIATLLKLHATTRVCDKENEASMNKPVLLPPDYYIHKKYPKKSIEKEPCGNTPIMSENSPIQPVLNKKEEASTSSNTTLNNTPQAPSESTSEPYDVDKEIRISIDKVNNWLNPKEPEKKSMPVFGPITFKKKENKTQSPVESKGSTTPKKTRRDSKEFIPSNNALKQNEIYMQRIKEREMAEKKVKSKVTLENLEETLRARDAKIRNELNNSFTNSNSS